jgi:hypothetical protein
MVVVLLSLAVEMCVVFSTVIQVPEVMMLSFEAGQQV